MKFKNIQDYQLLRTCLKIKELKLTPELINHRNTLRSNFSSEEISTINEIAEELYNVHLLSLTSEDEEEQTLEDEEEQTSKDKKEQKKGLSTESGKKFEAIISSIPDPRVRGEVIEYMDTYVTLLEYRRLLNMKTDPERLAWLEAYMIFETEGTRAKKSETNSMKVAASKDSEDKFNAEQKIIDQKLKFKTEAPTTRVARFATTMLTMSPHSIAYNYAKAIEAQKFMYRINGQDTPELVEKLGTLQRHLLDNYPKNIKAPQIHEESVIGNFIDDIRTGKGVKLAVANTAKTARGRNVLTSLLIAGIGVPLLAMSIHASALAKPANDSRYQDLINTPAIVQMFDQNQLAQIKGYEDMFAKFEQEGVLPSNSELHALINSMDTFYSDSIKSILLESYNEYADENNKPHARSITFQYNDTEKNDGPQNILIVTDEKGKNHTVDTSTTNIFEKNNIGAIYTAERRIDGYRNDLNAYPNGDTRKAIITKLQGDFYKVLDALTLDYTFERNGLVQRAFGDDFKLTSTSQANEQTTSSTHQATQEDIDDQR